jgi:EpsI family protein
VENTSLRHSSIAAAILCVFAVLMVIFQNRGAVPVPAAHIEQFPTTIGQWTMIENEKMDARIIDILGTNDVVCRVYQNENQEKVRMIIVAATNNRSAFHPPEYCLTGGGAEITEKTVRKINLKELSGVNEMVVTAANQNDLLVWNWYMAGKEVTHSFFKQQMLLVYEQLVHGKAPGIVVNIYTPIENTDRERTRRINKEFVQAVTPLLSLVF